MQIPLPTSEHPQVQVTTLVNGEPTTSTTLDRSHKVLEIADKIKGEVDHVAQFLDSTGKAVSEKMVYVKGSWQTWASKVKATVTAKVQDHKAEIEETAAVAKIAAEVVK